MATPSLSIRRVRVDGALSCDLGFTRGLNVVLATSNKADPRSTNKAGKTALVELIRHGFGNEQDKNKYHFAPIQSEISTLWLEIEANGEVLTIERSLQQLTASVRIREGGIVPNIEKTPAGVVALDYLSEFLLGALNIPVVSVKTAEGTLTPLSFNLLARTFILHQKYSYGGILNQVQPESRKADVIGFITGAISLRRFEIEHELAKVQSDTKEQEAYYNSVRAFLSKNNIPSIIEAYGRVQAAEEELARAKEAQYNLQQRIKEATETEQEDRKGRIAALRAEMLKVEEDTARVERSLFGLQQEEERIREVLSSLVQDRQKSERLQVSSTILSSVEFGICPRCLLEITPEMKAREQHARCSLCARPLRTTSDTPPKSVPRTDDIDIQIEEAEAVLGGVIREREELQARQRQLEQRRNDIGRVLDDESRAYVSPAVDMLLEQANTIALKEAALTHTRGLLEQAEALENIRTELEALREKQARLEDTLRDARVPKRGRLEALRRIYENILTELEFPGFESCRIDPHTLMPYINGSLYIHQGIAYTGLAVIAYHLALLELSLQEKTLFPKLLVVDSPAVGDLNEKSHDKLLSYLFRLAARENDLVDAGEIDEARWQIILTERRIIPDLLPYRKAVISGSPEKMLLRRKGHRNFSPAGSPADSPGVG
jgi:uncharacterized protein YydD (DUF2326 family)